MKLTLFIVSALLWTGVSTAIIIPLEGNIATWGEETKIRPECHFTDRMKAVSFLRAFNSKFNSYFYTTDRSELKKFTSKRLRYKSIGSAGLIFKDEERGTVPLYRLRLTSKKSTDYLYTTSPHERDAAERPGYVFEGIAGYIYSTQLCGSIPFYRLYDAKKMVHFYTTDEEERDQAIEGGYKFENIAGYLFEEGVDLFMLCSIT